MLVDQERLPHTRQRSVNVINDQTADLTVRVLGGMRMRVVGVEVMVRVVEVRVVGVRMVVVVVNSVGLDDHIDTDFFAQPLLWGSF